MQSYRVIQADVVWVLLMDEHQSGVTWHDHVVHCWWAVRLRWRTPTCLTNPEDIDRHSTSLNVKFWPPVVEMVPFISIHSWKKVSKKQHKGPLPLKTAKFFYIIMCQWLPCWRHISDKWWENWGGVDRRRCVQVNGVHSPFLHTSFTLAVSWPVNKWSVISVCCVQCCRRRRSPRRRINV